MPYRHCNNVEYGRLDDDLVPVNGSSQPRSQKRRRVRPSNVLPDWQPPASNPPPEWEPLEIDNHHDCGVPKLPPEVDGSRPIDVFRLFWTDEIVQNLCHDTNEMARQRPLPERHRAVSWYNVTPNEMYRYLAILVHMGVYREAAVHNY